MQGIEIFGLLAGIVTSGAMMPQLVKTWKNKDVKALSVKMFIVYIVGFSMWITYGIIEKDTPIVATNALSIAMSAFMIYMKWKYNGHS